MMHLYSIYNEKIADVTEKKFVYWFELTADQS